MFLGFPFWEPVFYAAGNKLLCKSPELSGCFVGFAMNCGDALTHLIITDDTKQIIHRSTVRSWLNVKDKNLRVSPIGGEINQPVSKPLQYIYSKYENDPTNGNTAYDPTNGDDP